MPKAGRVLAALKRDGWIPVRQKGSHLRLQKREREVTWAFHDRLDLGTVQMKQIAKQFGYTLDELRKLG